MLNLIAIGDPVIDTHVQIDNDNKDCRLVEDDTMVALTYGAKIPIVDSFQTLGGNAANVTVAATKLGLECAVLSTVGDDSNGKLVLEHLKKAKVDTSLITTEHEASTRYSIVLNYKAERTILSYSEKRTYIWPEPIPETEWMYYTGLGGGYQTVQAELLQLLSKHPTVRLAVNPGSFMLRYGKDDIQEVLKHTDILLVNLEEAEKLTGKTLAEEKSQAALIHELLQMGVKEVVITDGARGVWGGNSQEIFSMESYPVKVLAKTGAGDAFAAAYLTARMRGHDISHALEWGTANSCSVISAHGPHAGLLNEAGIKKMIAKYSVNCSPVLL